MEIFLEPRKAYHRTATDELDLKTPDSTVELRSFDSTTTFQSGFQSDFHNGFQSNFQSNFKSGFSNSIARDGSPLLDPATDPVRHHPPFSWEAFKKPFAIWPKSLYGWRTGALTSALLAAISLAINFAVVIWLGVHGHGAGLVELYNGSCSEVEKIDLWVHLAINVLSTLLLGGSNYCMQCLCAPTRANIDRAHAQGKFVDIGVPSIRNLRRVPLYKTMLWLALGLTSVPLHLMYNSSFYKSLASNDYGIYTVTQDFVDGKPFADQTDTNTTIPSDFFGYPIDPQTIQASLLHNPAVWEPLDRSSCIKSYAQNFLSNRRNLILISSNHTSTANETVLATYTYTSSPTTPFYWICNTVPDLELKLAQFGYPAPSNDQTCGSYVNEVVAIGDAWTPFGYGVESCLSEKVPERCSYSGNIPIVAIVLSCNAVKLVVMLFVAFRLKDNPLITVGDAVQSFLDNNDRTTTGLCLLSKHDVVRAVRANQSWSAAGQAKYGDKVTGQLARRQRKLWASSASRWRWSLTLGFILLAVLISLGLFCFAAAAVRRLGFSISDVGFGKVSPETIITGWSIGVRGPNTDRILINILVANLPQTILSFLYLNLNGLLTSMWLASEWSDFASERKTLRVSHPKGIQRSTHFLQLPYKIALPLMVIAGVLHWLLSQSIFLAVVAEYSPTGSLADPLNVASCGFSPLAMISVIVLGALLIVFTLALGFLRRYDASIPLVGSCSAAIAAACHQPTWDGDASAKALQWGAIPDMMDSNGVGHCSFSSGEVERPLEGIEYAGTSTKEGARLRRPGRDPDDWIGSAQGTE
jgi:hypothetical protein